MSARLFEVRGYEDYADRLLHAIDQNNYAQVNNLLSRNISLLVERREFTNQNQQSFMHITAFQYALWSLNFKMCREILRVIPESEMGIKIRCALQLQAKSLLDEGLIYHKDKLTYTHQHQSSDLSPDMLLDDIKVVRAFLTSKPVTQPTPSACTIS